MDDLAKLVSSDLESPRRCFFHGTTALGGTDACRPELQDDGSVILRSLNLTHAAYRVTADEYREIRKYPKRKIGIWDFVDDNDPDADRIASATRSPDYAGRRIGDLERAISAKDAEIATLRKALTKVTVERVRDLVEWMDQHEDNASLLVASLTEQQIKDARNALAGGANA